MNQRQTIFERFRQLPPVVQWGAYIVLGIVVFLVWSDHLAPLSRDYKDQADRIAADVRTVRDTEALQGQIRQQRDVILGIGPVLTPRPAAVGELALSHAVNEVVGKYNVSNFSFGTRNLQAMRAGALPGLTGTMRAHMLTAELKFNATPEMVIEIIADLEARPEIDLIQSVRMTRMAGRRVSAIIFLEAWVLPTDGGGRGGRT